MSNVDNSGNPVDPTTQDPATQTGQGQQEPIQQVDPDSLFADQLASIQTDEGRQKFNSVDAALGSIPHAQQHIKELTDKLTAAEEELAKRQGAEELLDRLQQSQSPEPETTPQTLDAAAIQGLVEQVLQKNDQQAIATSNAQAVKQALQQKFGDAAPQEFERKASSLGLSVAQLTEMAATSPQVVKELFAATAAAPTADPTTPSSVSVSGQPQKQEEPDYMRKFRGSDNSTLSKWRKAGEAVNT